MSIFAETMTKAISGLPIFYCVSILNQAERMSKLREIKIYVYSDTYESDVVAV